MFYFLVKLMILIYYFYKPLTSNLLMVQDFLYIYKFDILIYIFKKIIN